MHRPALPGAPVSPSGPVLAGRLTLDASVLRDQTRATVRRRGLRLRVRCSTGCRLRITVATRRAGRSLGTARRTVTLRAGRATTVTVALTTQARRALRRGGRATLTTQLTATAPDGRTAAQRRGLTLRR